MVPRDPGKGPGSTGRSARDPRQRHQPGLVRGAASRARPGTALCFRVPGPPPTGRNPGVQSRRQPRASGKIFGRRLLGASEIIFTHGEKNDGVFLKNCFNERVSVFTRSQTRAPVHLSTFTQTHIKS